MESRLERQRAGRRPHAREARSLHEGGANHGPKASLRLAGAEEPTSLGPHLITYRPRGRWAGWSGSHPGGPTFSPNTRHSPAAEPPLPAPDPLARLQLHSGAELATFTPENQSLSPPPTRQTAGAHTQPPGKQACPAPEQTRTTPVAAAAFGPTAFNMAPGENESILPHGTWYRSWGQAPAGGP